MPKARVERRTEGTSRAPYRRHESSAVPKARVERRTEGTSRAPYRRHESSAVPKARVERRRAHEFSKGSRACSPGKFLNLESLKCHFPDFRERFNRILMVRKRHCNISEASMANVFALQPEPGGPHLAHWGWGPRVCPVRTHSSYATDFRWYAKEKMMSEVQ